MQVESWDLETMHVESWGIQKIIITLRQLLTAVSPNTLRQQVMARSRQGAAKAR